MIDQNQPTVIKCEPRSYRLNILGYHIAIAWANSYMGLVIWPPGTWPKSPIFDFWRVRQTNNNWAKA